MDHRKKLVIMSGVQTLVVKSDQEASTVDVKNALMRELHGVERLTVMPGGVTGFSRVRPKL